ncbi:MAG: lysylphosphatidylglycerol synthase transmembrane domain-containing protein [Bacteroidota bacterium]
MPRRLRAWLIQGGSLVLAGGLLYLALRGVSLAEVRAALAEADYRWLLPFTAAIVASHLLRAWRWKLLVDVLPSAEETRPLTLRQAFYAVMVGYMVNYAVPRLGEPIRAANVALVSGHRFSRVFGTVVVERALDVVVWAFALASLLGVFWTRLDILQANLLTPFLERIAALPLGLLTLAGALLLGLGAGLIWMMVRGPLAPRLGPLLRQFGEGLATVFRAPQRVLLVLLTLGMWFCYGLMAYLPLLLFGLTAAYDLTVWDGWGLMVLGSIGIALPSPGGIGSYHYITRESMQWLYAIPQALGASYALFTHGYQMILNTVLGVACLVIQGSSLKTLRATAEAAPSNIGSEA